jgi:hypothetical protein
MLFPDLEQLRLPCTFERLVPGRLHPDGRRYLPLILLRLPASPGEVGPAAMLNASPPVRLDPAATYVAEVTTLGVVDRHHVVDPALEGREGSARLVFLLSSVRLQEPPLRQGFADAGEAEGWAGMAPVAYGRVVGVPTWEAGQAPLPYESLYTELLLDVGIGIVGVRTSATAASLTESLGKARIEPGDWLRVSRSRIDILAFDT